MRTTGPLSDPYGLGAGFLTSWGRVSPCDSLLAPGSDPAAPLNHPILTSWGPGSGFGCPQAVRMALAHRASDSKNAGTPPGSKDRAHPIKPFSRIESHRFRSCKDVGRHLRPRFALRKPWQIRHLACVCDSLSLLRGFVGVKPQGSPRVAANLPYSLGETALPGGGESHTPRGVRDPPPGCKDEKDSAARPFPYLFFG